MYTSRVYSPLDINDFASLFDRGKLGKLYFPYGRCLAPQPNGNENTRYLKTFVELRDLFKVVTNWKVNTKISEIDFDQIMFIAACGSVVARQERGFQPRYTEFFVITRSRPLTESRWVEEVIEPYFDEHGTEKLGIERVGIRVFYHGKDKLLMDAKTYDLSITKMLQGCVPLISSCSPPLDLEKITGIPNKIKRRICWDEEIGMNGEILIKCTIR